MGSAWQVTSQDSGLFRLTTVLFWEMKLTDVEHGVSGICYQVKLLGCLAKDLCRAETLFLGLFALSNSWASVTYPKQTAPVTDGPAVLEQVDRSRLTPPGARVWGNGGDRPGLGGDWFDRPKPSSQAQSTDLRRPKSSIQPRDRASNSCRAQKKLSRLQIAQLPGR